MSEKIQVKEVLVVEAIVGVVQVIDAEGNIRTVAAGDKILPGETIVTDDSYLLAENAKGIDTKYGQPPEGMDTSAINQQADVKVTDEKPYQQCIALYEARGWLDRGSTFDAG